VRPRTLAVLFVLVAGLLAFIWFHERELPSSDERVELARRVLRLEPDEVQGLRLTRGDSAVRLQRVETGAGAVEDAGQDGAAGGVWRLREPLDAVADAAAVDRLVDQLTGLEKERTLEEVDPAELGLAEPRGRVALETTGGPVELLIGSEVPVSTTMIVGVAGREEAYVVGDSLWDELEKPAGDWRSRDLGPGSREAIQRISLGVGAGVVSLGRRGESFWVESPYVDKADKDLVSALLGEIVGLRVERFVDDPTAVEPLPAMLPLEVVLEGREEALRVQLGGPVGEQEDLRLARVDGQLVEIRTDLATALGRVPEQWRSRAWTALEVYQIDRLVARDATGETLFERDGGDWLRGGAPVAYEPVSELLYALTGIEAESALGGAAPSADPVLTLELSGDAAARQETLSLYAAGEYGASPARVDGREVTLLLGEGAVADLELKLAEARSAEAPSAEGTELEAPSED
jgi:hypothetical protein